MKEENKKSIWKRISALAASALLLFTAGSANDSVKFPELKPPEVNAEFDASHYNSILNNYPDLLNSRGTEISLQEILSLQVGEETCDTMVPQGLAFKDGLILVTAYDGINGYKSDLLLHSYRKEYREKLDSEKEHEPHNSVIIVLDQESKKILTTIELSDKNHVGGIAVDDENVYIAKSGDEVISVISLEKIKEAAKNGKEKGIKQAKIDYDYHMYCGCDSSFVSLRETEDGKNQLLVGTWIPFPSMSVIRVFDFGENNDLVLNQKFSINSSCNGATFVRREDKEYLIVACSMGRSFDSQLFVYEVETNDQGKIDLKMKSQSDLPPMVEEVAEYENQDGRRMIAINSEAFSTRYEIGRNKIISNGIIVSDLDKLLDREGRPTRKGLGFKLDMYNPEKPKEEIDEEEKKKKDKDKDIER